MIVYPTNWRELGKRVETEDIDKALREIITNIPCDSLSYSGGIDSSLLLYYLLEVKGVAKCFTVANDKDHPDIYYSQLGINYYEQRYGLKISHSISIRPHLQGDNLVKCFYSNLSAYCKGIITGDCIDELACGYYKHQDLQEETYQEYLQRLQVEHLIPLDANSGDVKVYLPFADDRIANLLHRIPLYRKAGEAGRKIIITQLADGKVPQEIIERKKYGFATSPQKLVYNKLGVR